ncbi:MAG: hypothetical protein H6868_06505 [Rhodospirillales bacterium]|nr:hypothetical protein [Rhodospirillales bacterium]
MGLTAKRLANREKKQRVREEAKAGIIQDIKRALTYEQLLSKHSPKILLQILANLALEQRHLVDRALGKPPQDHLILIDECLPLQLFPDVHRDFGRAIAAPHVVPQKTKDDALYAIAAKIGVHTILTNDGRQTGNKNLCAIANRHYQTNEAQCPGIIVISQAVDQGLSELNANRRLVHDYLASRPSRILDLRPS